MSRTSDCWVLLARLAQIILGLVVFGFAIELGAIQETGGLPVTAIMCGANVALFGAFGLFGLGRRPDDDGQVRLFGLLMFIDCWALAFSIAGGVCFAVSTKSWEYWEESLSAMIIAPAIVSFVSTFVILALMIRTLRLWWGRMVYNSRPRRSSKNNYDYEIGYAYTHAAPQSYGPVQAVPTATPAPRNNVEEVKTPFSSRPQSFLSGADTIIHPNIAYVTHTTLPSRAASAATSSYPTRVEVGSKIERT